MATPTHTYGQAALVPSITDAGLAGAGIQGSVLESTTRGATVSAVTLTTPYPSDNLYPSDSLFPDSTYLPTGLSDAVLVARVGDARLTATASGGSILTSNGVSSAAITATPALANVQT